VSAPLWYESIDKWLARTPFMWRVWAFLHRYLCPTCRWERRQENKRFNDGMTDRGGSK
jgi:hypothetical protein